MQKYRDASKIELRVLATLNANDADNCNKCIHLRDCFDYRGHIYIVMDMLGQSIFDFLKVQLGMSRHWDDEARLKHLAFRRNRKVLFR